MKKNIVALMLLSLLSVNAFAAKSPKDGRTDTRIKKIVYNENDVVRIHSHFNFGTHIILSPSETIAKISIGDSISWLLDVENNHLFIKPIDDGDTNLILLTNKRVYNFELHANEAKDASDKSLTFQVRFLYPKEEMHRQLLAQQKYEEKQKSNVVPYHKVKAESWNFNYSRKGSDIMSPIRTFDDGKFTYFQFKENVDLPAIFMVDENKEESLVNFHLTDKYLVVERVAAQFILRHGNIATCIFNESFDAIQETSELKVRGESTYGEDDE